METKRTSAIYNIWFAAALCAAGLTACNNNDQLIPDTLPVKSQQVTITASQPQKVETRMLYNTSVSDGAPITSEWEGSDKFKVFGATSSGTVFTNELNTSAAVADFTGNMPTGAIIEGTYKAFYPADKATGEWSDCTLIATGQTQNGNGSSAHIGDFDYMTGNVTLPQTAPYTADVTFTREMAMIKFNLTLPDAVAVSGAPVSIILSTDNEHFYTQRGIEDNSATPDAKMISLQLSGMDSYTDAIQAYMMMIPTTDLENENMTITVSCKTKTYSVTKKVIANLQAGSYYTINISSGWSDTTAPDWLFDNAVASMTNFSGINFESGNGAKDNAYEIATAKQLKYLINQVNVIGEKYADTYFKLTTDIHVTADTWTPIGKNSTNTFHGNFNGDGHIVTGQFIARDNNIGFIGYIESNTTTITIENLTIATNITASLSNVGGIIGHIGSSVSAAITINDCHFSGNIIADYYAGGIVGRTQYSTIPLTVTDCTSRGRIENRTSGEDGLGGIIGLAFITNCTITDCINYASITGKSPNAYNGLSGIIGAIYGGTISNCKNYGDIDGNTKIGGIVGNADNLSVTFENNKNYGKIGNSTSTNVGGITGYDIPRGPYNSNINYSTEIYGSSYVGGITGYYNESTLNGDGLNTSVFPSLIGGATNP